MHLFLVAALAGALLATVISPALADDAYPAKPVRVVIGFAAGGGTDLVGRMAAEQLGRRLGVPIVVENVPGAGQNVAAARVARAAPDGYTLFMSSAGLTINPWLHRDPGYKPLESFAPVALFGQAPNALVVAAPTGARTPAELVSYLRGKGTGNFSSAGVGTTHHLSAELFKLATGIERAEHVAYKSAAEAVTAVVRADVDFAFVSVPSAKSLVGNDRVRILGLTGAGQSKLMPGVPMLSQAGVSGMEIGTWYGLLLPAGTPPAIVEKLAAAMNTDHEPLSARLSGAGVDSVQIGPDAFARFLREDLARWGRVIERIKLEKQP